jgi:hypothetical protein
MGPLVLGSYLMGPFVMGPLVMVPYEGVAPLAAQTFHLAINYRCSSELLQFELFGVTNYSGRPLIHIVMEQYLFYFCSTE